MQVHYFETEYRYFASVGLYIQGYNIYFIHIHNIRIMNRAMLFIPASGDECKNQTSLFAYEERI